MLDINFIRENKEKVKDSIKRRGLKVDLEKLLKLDEERRQLIQKAEGLRSQLKVEDKPTADQQEKLQATKASFETANKELTKVEDGYAQLMQALPNVIAQDTPDGGEENNRVEKETKKPKLDYKPKDHQTLAEANDWLDFERGAKVAGAKFYYLKGAAVRLQMAVMQFVIDLLAQDGFVPMIVPHMVKSRIAEGTGFAPRGKGEEEQEYKVDGEDLTLIGTAEVPLTGYHADEILDESKLPLHYAGLSPSYRKEAGAHGKHSKGLYRVHQFDKLEMYVFCKPADSDKTLQQILKLEEKICDQLQIPYRVVRIAAGDLGAPAYQKYDLEYWSPVDESYRELTSCSNCTDYQARNLNIRTRGKDGKTQFCHTLNGTAVAFSRVFIALLENLQTKDGKVEVPKALQSYMGGAKTL